MSTGLSHTPQLGSGSDATLSHPRDAVCGKDKPRTLRGTAIISCGKADKTRGKPGNEEGIKVFKGSKRNS